MKITNKRKLKCFLIEDSVKDIDQISGHIKNHPRLEYLGTSINLPEVSKILSSTKIDILFLDNELGTGLQTLRNGGFEFFEILKNTNPGLIPHVVVVSKYYEIDTQKGMSLGAWDVIAKPFGEDTFNERIQRVIDDIDIKEQLAFFVENESKGMKNVPVGKITIPAIGTNQVQHLIDLSEIVYIEANAQIIKIHLADAGKRVIETWNTTFTLKSFLNEILSPVQLAFFSQIQRSFIVNVCYISEVEANDKLYLKGITEPIPIGNGLYKENTLNKWKALFSS
jgi:DNA-binding LytR/AlgR family response regulator